MSKEQGSLIPRKQAYNDQAIITCHRSYIKKVQHLSNRSSRKNWEKLKGGNIQTKFFILIPEMKANGRFKLKGLLSPEENVDKQSHSQTQCSDTLESQQ